MTEKKPKNFLFQISGGIPLEVLITVNTDLTIVTHKAGAEEQAARVFWETVQIEGQTVYEQLEAWKKRALMAEEELLTLRRGTGCLIN